MTDLQLKLMERADKTLSFGCIIEYEHPHNGCFPVGGGSGEVDYYDDMLIGTIGCLHRDVFIEGSELYLRLADYDIDESSGELIESNQRDELVFSHVKQVNGERRKLMDEKELEDKKRRAMRHSGELKTEKQNIGLLGDPVDGKYSCIDCFKRSLNYRRFGQIENIKNDPLFTLTCGETVSIRQFMECPNVIGHPYGIGRLIYFYEMNYMKMPNLISKIGAINNHLSMNPILYTKPCIDRPEGSQRLALEFLESLPK